MGDFVVVVMLGVGVGGCIVVMFCCFVGRVVGDVVVMVFVGSCFMGGGVVGVGRVEVIVLLVCVVVVDGGVVIVGIGVVVMWVCFFCIRIMVLRMLVIVRSVRNRKCKVNFFIGWFR